MNLFLDSPYLQLFNEISPDIKVYTEPYMLNFKLPSGTSRGVLTQKKIWLIKSHQTTALGECAPLAGLSIDALPNYDEILNEVCVHFNNRDVDKWISAMKTMPSIAFGFEIFLLDAMNKGTQILFDTDFVQKNEPVPINGLVWMGSKEQMKTEIKQKIEAGYTCIKLKIGAIDFEAEMDLLKEMRKSFGAETLEIRVDANGAFGIDAAEKLQKLSTYHLHSIEQPIAPHQHEAMRQLCAATPLPIALDEELIFCKSHQKAELLAYIKPQYVVLKPSLLGGFAQTQDWINQAQAQNIGWWITSALESNIALNALAQFAYTLQPKMPQGLGTGQLFTNNFEQFLMRIQNGKLYYR